jgi:hypothetical protein
VTLWTWFLASWASLTLLKYSQAEGVRHLSHPSHTSPLVHPWGPWRSFTPGWTGFSLLSGEGSLPVPYRSRFRVVVVTPPLLAWGLEGLGS